MKEKLMYHFIGIGGISMSALANNILKLGHSVQGSDLQKINPKDFVRTIKIFEGHDAENVKGADVVVFTNAISSKNPELLFAQKNGIKILSRAELLSQISSSYKNVIAVAGMHGKTTTTEMLAEIFINAGKKPTIHVGGISNFWGSNFLLGKRDYFICEACEFCNSFLAQPSLFSAVLNVEKEHLDFFKKFKNIKKSFKIFEKNSEIVAKIKNYNVSYSKNNFKAIKIQKQNDGKYIFTILKNKKVFATLKLNAFGKFNIKNALFAIAISNHYGIDVETIKNSLEKYRGVKRRFEEIKSNIIHDYAHHPTQIKIVSRTVRSFCEGKLLIAFQPHTFSRTKILFKQFICSFKFADVIYIIKEYSAREKHSDGKSAHQLFVALKAKYPRKKIHYFHNFTACANSIKKTILNNDYLLILGAGNIVKMCSEFESVKIVKKLQIISDKKTIVFD